MDWLDRLVIYTLWGRRRFFMGSEAPLLPVTYTPFFILNNLRDFDGIIGVDLIKQVNAKLDFTGNVLHTSKGTEKTKNIKTRKKAIDCS